MAEIVYDGLPKGHTEGDLVNLAVPFRDLGIIAMALDYYYWDIENDFEIGEYKTEKECVKQKAREDQERCKALYEFFKNAGSFVKNYANAN